MEDYCIINKTPTLGMKSVCELEVAQKRNGMNERIEGLAKQLGPVATIGNWGRVEWADNIYPQIGDTMYASIDLEKFAELIVFECIDAAFHRGHPDLEFLLKHFGVEE